jgi:chromosome segregation ATPase
MKIRKFYEAEETVDISNERVKELIDQLSGINTLIDSKKTELMSILSELSNFRSKSTKSNDQIDDSVSNLETIETKISDISTSLDTVVNNLKDYNDSGRKYLY